jgi:hypothetical protein
LKPKESEDLDLENARETSTKVKEWSENWGKIEQSIQQLHKDCSHFNLPEPKFGGEETKIKSELAN